MTDIEDYLLINNQEVVKGALHEIDHILNSKLGVAFGLRVDNRRNDQTATIRQEKPAHNLPTKAFAEINPKLKVGNLTQPLSDLLKPLLEVDREVWLNKKNGALIRKCGLTPEYVWGEYRDGHTDLVSRISSIITDKDFHWRQSTACFLDLFIKEGMQLSRRTYAYYSVPAPPTDLFANTP
jgi:hypothetical protein